MPILCTTILFVVAVATGQIVRMSVAARVSHPIQPWHRALPQVTFAATVYIAFKLLRGSTQAWPMVETVVASQGVARLLPGVLATGLAFALTRRSQLFPVSHTGEPWSLRLVASLISFFPWPLLTDPLWTLPDLLFRFGGGTIMMSAMLVVLNGRQGLSRLTSRSAGGR